MTPTLLAQQGIEVHVLPATVDVRADQPSSASTGCSSPTARATRPAPSTRSPCCARCSTRGSRSSASASATSCSAGRSASAPTSSSTATAASTSRCIDRTTGKVEVTAHNHGFAVDAPLDGEVTAPSDGALGTAYGRVRVSHVCLNDDVVEGLECLDLPAYSVQYHPEAAAGPHDAGYLFDRFVELMDACTTEHRLHRPPHRPGRARLMPSRADISSVLVIGSGPIVIGQACEFDYSGTQACRVLREEGIRVILVNSNPATIMTDPEFADATYVEPIIPEVVEAIIAKERPDAVLATLGGQTALNGAIALHEQGILEKYDCPLIGANVEAIQLGEDRAAVQGRRRALRRRVGPQPDRATRWTSASTPQPSSATRWSCGPRSPWAASAPASRTTRPTCAGSPAPACTTRRPPRCSSRSPSPGWKEYELEVMRDHADNVVVVCSIENLDPMGVHTGDSITVAPALTLTDREYQRLRDIGIAIIREVGVDTGGCNIQFAVNPRDGRIIVIEMNPRVSRSSALASKATGFPIAKIAAKMAIGYTLDEVPNDITRETPASFEPTLDYVVVKVPRFAFEKFPAADPTLTTTMKSVGEAMSIGRNFTEALQKALRSLEQQGHVASTGHGEDPSKEQARALLQQAQDAHRRPDRAGAAGPSRRAVGRGGARGHRHRPVVPRPDRPHQRRRAIRVAAAPAADRRPAAAGQAARLQRRPARLAAADARGRRPRRAPRARGAPGLQDRRHLRGRVRRARRPTTTAPTTRRPRSRRASGRPCIILGSGPNRIGQGVEFDYSCVHASFALRDAGFDTVMVNCNPETVSTDYDTSSRLYFEPLTLEDVLEVVHAEQPGRARSPASSCSSAARRRSAWPRRSRTRACRSSAPRPRPSTSPRTAAPSAGCWPRPSCPRPSTARPTAPPRRSRSPARSATPCSCGPSYVLGGRGMEIVYDDETLAGYVEPGHARLARAPGARRPVPRRRDRDRRRRALRRHRHVPRRDHGAHRGGRHPLRRLGLHAAAGDARRRRARAGPRVARSSWPQGIGVRGPDERPVRPGPGHPLRPRGQPAGVAHRAVRRQGDRRAAGQGRGPGHARRDASRSCARRACCPPHGDGGRMPAHAPVSVKEAVLPFKRFRTKEGQVVDSLLGPEMRSTGEVMGIDTDFGPAFAKAQLGAVTGLPAHGHDLRVGRQPRQAGDDLPGQAPGRPRLHDLSPPRAPRTCCGATAIEATVVRKHSERAGADGEPIDRRPHPRRRGATWSSTPRRARTPGPTATPSGPRRRAMDKPIITTVQQLARGGAGHRGAA